MMTLQLKHTIIISLCLLALSASAQKRPPNIVLIFMDDMGYADVGVYGAKNFKTPHIDKLAEEGMRFTNFYAAQPICTPSRAALLTGCYPNRIGLRGALFPNAKTGLNSSEETIAELLKKKNYATAIVGKWHLGDALPFLPLQHGFDEYFGIPYSNDMWPKDDLGRQVDTGHRKYRMPPLPLMEGNSVKETIDNLDEMGMLTTRYTQRAIQFIQKNKHQPFFLYLAHSMPHVPIAVSDKFKGKSGAGLYGDVIMEADWSVSEVMRALRDEGLEENTLVVFTSDNGPWLTYGNHAGSAVPFREGKMTTWEGGVREACIVRWPGVVPAGTVNHSLATTIDLLPTFASITGAPLPANKIDGINITKLFTTTKQRKLRKYFYYYYGANNLQAVRSGQWKLVFPHRYLTIDTPGQDGLTGKGHRDTTGLALYNLSNDPGETKNVLNEYPAVVRRLQLIAGRARKDLGDDLTGAKGSNRREPGKIE